MSVQLSGGSLPATDFYPVRSAGDTLFYRIFGVLSMRFFLHGFVFVIIAWAISTVRRQSSDYVAQLLYLLITVY